MDTSKITPEEVELIQLALTHYEQRNYGDADSLNKVLAVTRAFQDAANNDLPEGMDNVRFTSMMEQLNTQLQIHKKEVETTGRVERERITLLKAKMILAAQGKAVEQLWSDIQDDQ